MPVIYLTQFSERPK